MKRNGVVLNAREVRAGRDLIRWARAGVMYRALLGRGAEFAAKFYRAANLAAGGGAITSSDVAALIRAAYFGQAEAEKMASELEELAAEREADRSPYASWTYDAETEACRRLAAAIRYIAE